MCLHIIYLVPPVKENKIVRYSWKILESIFKIFGNILNIIQILVKKCKIIQEITRSRQES